MSICPTPCRRRQENTVGQDDGLVNTMRDEDHGLAGLLPDLDEFDLQQHARLLVEFAEGLIHQQNFRIGGKRPRHAHSFLHSSRELERIRAGEPGQTDLLKIASDRAPDDRLLHALDAQPVADVLLDGHPRKH